MCAGLKISYNNRSITFPQNIPDYAPNYTAVKVKVKFTIEKAMKTQRW
jgi:hypothetical protein